MKLVSILMTFMFLVTACQPNPSQRIRYAAEKENDFNSGTNSNYNNNGNAVYTGGRDDVNSNGTSNGSTNGSDDGNENNNDNWLDALPESVRGCRWSEDGNSGFANYHASIGAYTMCQATDELEIYIQLQNPPSGSTPICLVPTNTRNGYTTYIGEPQCFPAYSSQQIYRVNMDKNREGASNLALNGVAMMKDQTTYYPFPYNTSLKHPDAYLYCLQALETFQDARYCYAFDSVAQYVQHDFD
jgi:hypothetical protein